MKYTIYGFWLDTYVELFSLGMQNEHAKSFEKTIAGKFEQKKILSNADIIVQSECGEFDFIIDSYAAIELFSFFNMHNAQEWTQENVRNMYILLQDDKQLGYF